MPRHTIIVEFEVKPEHRDDFLALIRQGAALTRATEPGCVQFEVVESEDDPRTILLFEAYRDEEARRFHNTHPRRAATAARYRDWIVGKRRFLGAIED